MEISCKIGHTHYDIATRQTRYRDFVAKFISLMRFSLGYTACLRLMKTVDLVFVPTLLVDNTLHDLENRRIHLCFTQLD